MASKTLLVVGVLMAALLLISSEVTAREMVETADQKELTKGAVEDQQCKRCRPCCGWWRPGCCRRCCGQQSEEADAVVGGAEDAAHTDKVPEVVTEGAVVDQRCKRCAPCCGWWRPGCCRRCCGQQSEAADAVVEGAQDAAHTDKAADVETEAKPHN